MNDPQLVDEARRWLRFAAEDIDVAQRLLATDGPTARHTCFLAQQAAEKALKAALVLEGIDFPFRHDLDALRNLLPDTWSVRRTHTDLAQLTEWAVEARYPGDWQEATATDAEQAVSQAREVYNSIAADFERCTKRGERCSKSGMEVYMDISSEARELLKTAAADNGSIMHLCMAGGLELFKAGSENKYKGGDPREIARWMGGIDDLLNRGYIKGPRQKGDELFEVTSEGYTAADRPL